MLVVGYSLFIVVAGGFLVIKSIHQFYFLQFTLALAMGIMTPAAMTTYSHAQKKNKEAGGWGMFSGGNYILMAIAAFIGGLLYKHGGLHAIFIAMIIIQTCSMLLALINRRINY